MYSESDGEREHELSSRSSTGSEVVMMNERAVASALCTAVPTVSNLNVTKTNGLHIGPKFVSVTQNVHNNEVVKGRFLGLELVSSKKTRKFRCSVAVFVCWALVVASGLAFYIFHFALQQDRLDIDLPLPRYLWKVVKNSSKAERLSCAAALVALITCVGLIVYFTIYAKDTSGTSIDIAPHEWNISRDMWLAQWANNTERTTHFDPLRLVIVQHTVSQECDRFIICAAELRTLQTYFLRILGYDIPYNFMIGNDGRVYEGRGWGMVGAHTFTYNRCTLGLGFIGDYREDIPSHSEVNELQLKRTKLMLEEGVRRGFLHPNYHIVGAKDVRITDSPGSNLYKALQKMEHFDHEGLYRDKTCEEIYAMFDP